MEERPLLLVGYFGYGNLGDEETLRVFSERLRSRGIPYRVLCGGREKRSGHEHALPLRKAFRKEECVIPHAPTLAKDKLEAREGFLDTVRRGEPLALLRAIRECRGVILVGGNLLQSESSIRSLLYYAALLRYAVRLGKPILLFGGGLGGFRGGISEIVMQKLLPQFSYLGLRSEGDISSSLRFSVEKCKVHFTPDLCFSLSDGIYADSEGGCKDLKKRYKDTKERFEDSEERYEDPKGEREDSDRMYEKAKDVVFIPRKAAASDICFWRILDAVREAGRHAVIAVFFPREDGAALSRLAAKAGASLVTPRTYEEFSHIAAAAECTVCERFHGGVFSLLSHTVCYLRTTSEKCKGLYETVESLAPSGGLLVPFQSYEELLPRLQKLLGTRDEMQNRTYAEPPLAEAETIRNESYPTGRRGNGPSLAKRDKSEPALYARVKNAPALVISEKNSPFLAERDRSTSAKSASESSRADRDEGAPALMKRSESEPAPAITSGNDPCRMKSGGNASNVSDSKVSRARRNESDSAPAKRSESEPMPAITSGYDPYRAKKGENASTISASEASRARRNESDSAPVERSEREPASAVTSGNDPAAAKRHESAPSFAEGDSANKKTKKEIGDKASDFSRVISLLRDKEEEKFTLFLREFSGE